MKVSKFVTSTTQYLQKTDVNLSMSRLSFPTIRLQRDIFIFPPQFLTFTCNPPFDLLLIWDIINYHQIGLSIKALFYMKLLFIIKIRYVVLLIEFKCLINFFINMYIIYLKYRKRKAIRLNYLLNIHLWTVFYFIFFSIN